MQGALFKGVFHGSFLALAFEAWGLTETWGWDLVRSFASNFPWIYLHLRFHSINTNSLNTSSSLSSAFLSFLSLLIFPFSSTHSFLLHSFLLHLPIFIILFFHTSSYLCNLSNITSSPSLSSSSFLSYLFYPSPSNPKANCLSIVV